MKNEFRRGDIIIPALRLVAWELTRSCNLYCAHCRGSAGQGQFSGELSTGECFRVIDQILEIGRPILILSGGEPLMRPDCLDIARYAVGKGLRVVMGSNGTLISEATAATLKTVPVSRLGISLDFPTPELQDNFRGQAGAYDAAIAGMTNARRAGIELQVNSTITKLNIQYLDDLLKIALGMGAASFHPFLLVPTGRGKGLESVELSPEQYEQALNWLYDRQSELGDSMQFKPTCAPHYMRVTTQRRKSEGKTMPSDHQSATHPPMHSLTRGCMAGTGFCFISHRGVVQGCGYLDIPAGNVREQGFDRVWAESPLFNSLRDLANIKGKCGVCEYRRICGGCRARAYESTADYLDAEPYCIYEPVAKRRNNDNGGLIG
ncbi:MAG: radical SAM protein [Chloroflexi bacterium]|nr:radical SAM protein [Chloroflexota bacterium]